MSELLIFFALPIATIILAIVLEKLINNPILVAAIFFAIYLIVAFAAFDETFLIAVIIYTIIAFIAALLTCLFKRFICNTENNLCCNNNDAVNDEQSDCGCNRNINYRCYRRR